MDKVAQRWWSKSARIGIHSATGCCNTILFLFCFLTLIFYIKFVLKEEDLTFRMATYWNIHMVQEMWFIHSFLWPDDEFITNFLRD